MSPDTEDRDHASRMAWADDEIVMISEAHPDTLQYAGITQQVLDMGFNPGEMRDSRGRWTRFGGVGQAADVMMKNREGFSVSVKTGGEPAHGYMVAQVDHTHVYPENILDDHHKLTRAIDDMLMSEKEAFRGQHDVYLGGWVHDGKLWLEPSDNIASQEQAVSEGRRRNQIAIWDVGGSAEIDTGGSGGGRITEHANPQGAGEYPGGLLGPAGEAAAGGSSTAGIADLGGGTGELDVDTILDQLDPGGLMGQLLDMTTPVWQREARGPDGKWVSGMLPFPSGPHSPGSAHRHHHASPSSVQRSPDASVIRFRGIAKYVAQNRMTAEEAIAARVAEEKARKALEQARAEVEKATRALREEERTADNARHRTKLAMHAVMIMGGAILAAIMAHFDISPVLSAFAGAIPLLVTELADWRKKL